MGAATVSKLWAGYCDAVEAYQDDQIVGTQRLQSEALRTKSTNVIRVLLEADLVKDRLEQLQVRLAELVGQQDDLNFTPQFSDDYMTDICAARDTWLGESGRFGQWSGNWSVILPFASLSAAKASHLGSHSGGGNARGRARHDPHGSSYFARCNRCPGLPENAADHCVGSAHLGYAFIPKGHALSKISPLIRLVQRQFEEY